MRLEKVFCPLMRCDYCLENGCALWHQYGSVYAGCILKTVVWATGELLKQSSSEVYKIKQDEEGAYREQLACPNIELDGEIFDVLIEDNTRIMEITDRLRKCKSRKDLKKFAEEESLRERRGIQIIN